MRTDAKLLCACSEVVIKSRGDDEIVRAKILIIKGNQVFAVCKGCNKEVALPLEKSVAKPEELGPDLYLAK